MSVIDFDDTLIGLFGGLGGLGAGIATAQLENQGSIPGGLTLPITLGGGIGLIALVSLFLDADDDGDSGGHQIEFGLFGASLGLLFAYVLLLTSAGAIPDIIRPLEVAIGSPEEAVEELAIGG